MPKVLRGEITLGVGEEAYDGLWVATKDGVTFTFAEALPAPFNSTTVHRPLPKKFFKLTPYEMGGQMVNEIVAARNA